MNKKSLLKLILFALLLELFVFPKAAHAYLDPGSTSYLFQILIAGFLGAMFYIKTIIKKVKEIFKISSPKKVTLEEDENS